MDLDNVYFVNLELGLQVEATQTQPTVVDVDAQPNQNAGGNQDDAGGSKRKLPPKLPKKFGRKESEGRKVKFGERITALQQIVSPFGKIDAASVLLEAMQYIVFLQGQVQILCAPYRQSTHVASQLFRVPSAPFPQIVLVPVANLQDFDLRLRRFNGYKHCEMKFGDENNKAGKGTGDVTMKVDSLHQPPLDPSNNGHNVVTAEENIIVVTSSDEGKIKTQMKCKIFGVESEVSKDDILKCAKMRRKEAAKELKVSVTTLKHTFREYGIIQQPAWNIDNVNPFRPSPVVNQGQIPQLNSDLPSNQALAGVAHINPGYQDANMVTIKAKYEKNTIKFRLSLLSGFVELQQEVAKRLNLEAGTYHVRYKDEEGDLILIACDEDLQECMHASESQCNTSIVVLLEPKEPDTSIMHFERGSTTGSSSTNMLYLTNIMHSESGANSTNILYVTTCIDKTS